MGWTLMPRCLSASLTVRACSEFPRMAGITALCSEKPVSIPFSLASRDRKSTRLNSSHSQISDAVFCLKQKKRHLHVGAELVQLHLDHPTHERPATHPPALTLPSQNGCAPLRGRLDA